MHLFAFYRDRAYPVHPADIISNLIEVARQLTQLSLEADPGNGGPGSMDWEDLDPIHEMAKRSVDVSGAIDKTQNLPILAVQRWAPDGGVEPEWTQEPQCLAAAAAERLVKAYADGQANGGSVDWSDVDEAIELARQAVPPAILAAMQRKAREVNGMVDDDSGDSDDSHESAAGNADPEQAAADQPPRDRGERG